MTNIHDPVRAPNETLKEYDERRRRARLTVKIETTRSQHDAQPAGRSGSRKANRPIKASGYTPPAKAPKERKRKPQGKPVIGARRRLVDVQWQPTPKPKDKS